VKAKDVYGKTMKFVWMKLAMGLAYAAICAIIMGIMIGIGYLTKNPAVLYILFLVGLIGCAGIHKVMMVYFGYMLKASHVAVIATAVTNGEVPEDMFNVGKNLVKERFVEANAYFVLDKLISGAVSQIQKGVGKVGDLLENVPGMDTVVTLVNTFIGIILGYIDECCLGYTFINKDENVFKAGCDGVVIYFQNIKKLLKDALVTTLIVVVVSGVSFALPFAIFVAMFWKLEAIGILLALFLAAFIASAIKDSFVDSYMMVKMMTTYMQVAPTTEIKFDVYDKLCKLSGKFKELFNKSKVVQ